jgi:hypothetical protein
LSVTSSWKSRSTNPAWSAWNRSNPSSTRAANSARSEAKNAIRLAAAEVLPDFRFMVSQGPPPAGPRQSGIIEQGCPILTRIRT